MKKILKPSTSEECVYYSDISGKCFGTMCSDVECKITFRYGSKRDGESFELHFSDTEFSELMSLLQHKLLPSTLQKINGVHQ